MAAAASGVGGIDAAAAELLKNPQFIEMFQAAMGTDKPPAEGDPGREAWLKNMQERLYKAQLEETKKKLETPVTDADGQWMYIVPEPGFCIKCHTVERNPIKVFINICEHPKIAEPQPMEDLPAAEGEEEDPETKGAIKYRIPLSCGSKRRDTDKAGKECAVYDVVVNPATIKRCKEEHEFRRFVAALCMTWIKQKSEPNLNADEFTNVNIKVKGTPEMQRIRLAKPGPVNAMGDEIKLPGRAGDAATAPAAAGGRSVGIGGTTQKPGRMVVEIEPEVPKPSLTLTKLGNYDWSTHAKPSKNAYFREVVPETIDVDVFLPGVQTIGEVDVRISGRLIDFAFVDAEPDAPPFFCVTLPFPIEAEPRSAKFVRKTQHLMMSLVVRLPDEMAEEAERVKRSTDADTEEAREAAAREAEREKALNEYREKQARLEQEEKDVMEQRKTILANMSAVAEGNVPPVLQKEIDELPVEEARRMMVRLEQRILRGDSVDELIGKLPSEVIDNLAASIRKRLGLEALPPKQAPPPPPPPPKAAPAAGASSGVQETEYNFAKKAETLFGVKLYNRYVFALEH